MFTVQFNSSFVSYICNTNNINTVYIYFFQIIYTFKRMGISGKQVSLGMQFVASFFWAIGAILAGPATAADFLQFFAAVAWCIANVASAWSMYVNKNNTFSVETADKKNVEMRKI